MFCSPLSDEEWRVLESLLAGRFEGTEPSVIFSLCRRGYVANDEGRTIKITAAGRAALLIKRVKLTWPHSLKR